MAALSRAKLDDFVLPIGKAAYREERCDAGVAFEFRGPIRDAAEALAKEGIEA